MEVRLQGEPNGEGPESGLVVGNVRSWSKGGDQACMDGWEHMVEYKGIMAVCTVQAQRPTPQLEQAWGGGRGALAGRLPAACLPV